MSLWIFTCNLLRAAYQATFTQHATRTLLFISLLLLTSLTFTQTAALNDHHTYLPILSTDEPFQPSPEAFVQITPNTIISASTFNPGAFVITNLRTHGEQITNVRIDLSTAVLPDLVFDPAGTAGDVLAKDLQVEAGRSSTGFRGHTYDGAHAGGFDVLTLSFADFDPGEQLVFSIDVDPTSIRGAQVPGPNEAGSVSGLELAGSTITVTFGNGAVLTGYIYRQLKTNGGGEALIRSHLPTAPTILIAGQASLPVAVSEAEQVLVINGRSSQKTRILIIEGGLYTAGVPGGGFDLDPFEANSAVHIQEIEITTPTQNDLQIPITLTRSDENSGLNYIFVVQENGFGHKGQGSEPIVLQLVD
ncbi:MAG: hypothetical protein AAF614_25435 [Chloroflexota bacterium]